MLALPALASRSKRFSLAKVVFDAFVEEVQRGSRDGAVFALRTAETHRRKDDDGNYYTTARTYRQVKMAKPRDGDRVVGTLEGFAKGDRIHVEGSEKTERFTSNVDGRELYTLTVYADLVEPSGSRHAQPRSGRSTTTAPTFTPDEEPF